MEALGKVQLLQGRDHNAAGTVARARAALLQVRDRTSQLRPVFAGVMQKDLFDVLGTLEDYAKSNFHGFLQQRGGLLPWEKTAEQVGAEAKPNEMKGAAANAKSHNTRSGGIHGLLAEMR